MSPLAVRLQNFLRWFFDCSPTSARESHRFTSKERS